MLLAVSKGKKSRFYLKKIRPVQEDDNNYYFLQDEARPVTLEWRYTMQKSNIYVTKDSREMAYYIENGVQPYQLKGYKGVLSAYFYSEDIQDMRENWYPAIQQYRQEKS